MKTLILDTKSCMNQILLRDTFDSFYFLEGEIITSNKFNIDGHLHPAYFDEAPSNMYTTWKSIRDYCLTIIKGKRTPLSFRFVFSLTDNMIANFIKESNLNLETDSIQGLYYNLRFDDETLVCVTGTTLKEFSLDKTIEKSFDEYASTFFKKLGISVLSEV
ncbi:MAG: DUF5721 family protein [Suipraeoptans sp.]